MGKMDKRDNSLSSYRMAKRGDAVKVACPL
jgi:hypothetical protein